jgi:hypothetical protein
VIWPATTQRLKRDMLCGAVTGDQADEFALARKIFIIYLHLNDYNHYVDYH